MRFLALILALLFSGKEDQFLLRLTRSIGQITLSVGGTGVSVGGTDVAVG